VARLAHKHGKGKALTILAHKLARAVYHMLRRGQAFEATKFFHGEPRARTEVDRVALGNGHDASRSGPPGDALEGGRYLDPPDSTPREPRRRVHERDRVTPRRAAGAAERVEEKR
jgi:hypothetical protein